MELAKMQAEIRPTNMRMCHGLRGGCWGEISTSATECMDACADPWMARESGSGMDAPDRSPAGSVKAFVDPVNARALGLCQRDTTGSRW